MPGRLRRLLGVALARTHRSDLPLAVAFLDLDGLTEQLVAFQSEILKWVELDR